MKNKNSVYLAQPWGGLGDNFSFSNLPRLYNDQNIDFSLSFLNYTRSKEIKNLVWKNNPYVKNTFSLKFPNIGSRKLNTKEIDKKNLNVVQRINIFHDFSPGDGYPEIYLNFDVNPELKYDLVIDMNAFSMFKTYDIIYDKKSIENIIEELKEFKPKKIVTPSLYDEPITPDSLINNKINDLVNILLSTNTFYCLSSGSHTLAATLKNKYGFPKNIISFLPNLNENNLYDYGYVFKNVDYKNTLGVKNKNKEDPRVMRMYRGYIKKYFRD
ncbi:hypothetical protein N9U49_00585 [Acidimicrobiaceae bacterium]|nr:hypothetical protein [Acidimicrobiaceae bacterium]